MNYLYRRLAHNELASHKLSDYEEAFMDVENYDSGATPELDKMISGLNEGDTVDFESMAELGISSSIILSVLERLAEKRVSIRFLKNDLLVAHDQIKGSVEMLKAFYEAGLVNDIGLNAHLESRKLEQARGAAVLKGERLSKAIAIVREHIVDERHPKELARKHNLGVATIYRYIRNYSKEIQKEIKGNGE